ncbi:SEC-C domain-containing protein [Paenibacillus sp. HWE-109]|uniref:SEC-C domain-containing protein n=1 Tax=Paenibacillus sp. HWE-109 TaxID=1306526 RepID=UPI001EE05646|nr:SEC-C domain-containing protein [Paenibacillus sp. HWE-109]UKS27289.1 SEC-C domain-containing protein [Paenibacillus sp. HWE-109]
MGNGQKRNEICFCGSGKKFKRCCINKNVNISFKFVHASQQSPEPNLGIVPSLEFQGQRVRTIWSTLYFRPLRETFHEFLILMAYRNTYGKEFHENQVSIPSDKRHVTFKWWEAYCEWGFKNINNIVEIENGKVYYGTSTGEIQSLLQHAYDLFCLQIVNRLPEFFISKLRDVHEFQGVKYEVAVAAIMARAGFEIEFLDDNYKSEVHCEFIATHKESGQKIGVEAKSKRRKGVLHEEGEFNADADNRGNIQHLFRKARTQKPKDIPFLIFIDMNLPSTNVNNNSFDGEPPDKTWEHDIDQIYANYKNQSTSPDPFNAVYFTNFAFYYQGNNSLSFPWITYIKKSESPEHEIRENSLLECIQSSIMRYSDIPQEI